MDTYQINILNPKALKLLRYLADLELITLSKAKKEPFSHVVNRLRSRAQSDPLTLEEITMEVEKVRTKRHASKK